MRRPWRCWPSGPNAPRMRCRPLAREVMAECGRLPLALSICGAMRRDGTSWADILAALREADLEFLDHPHGNILKSIKVSIDALAPDQARRFAELAVFPPDETVPEAAVATLWSHTGPMKEREARRLLTVLERRALVRLDREAAEVGDDPKRRVSLHDLIYDYATRLAGDRVALHQQVLDAYSQRCPAGWPSGPNDGYFFQHLRHHLAEAGRDTELTSLLLDLPGWKPRPRPVWSSTWPWTSPGPWSASRSTMVPAVTCGCWSRPSASTSTSWPAIRPRCSSACGTGAGGMTVLMRPPIMIRLVGVARPTVTPNDSGQFSPWSACPPGPPIVPSAPSVLLDAPRSLARGERKRTACSRLPLAPFPPPARAGPGQSPARLPPRPCGHGHSVAYSPDGRRIVSGSQ